MSPDLAVLRALDLLAKLTNCEALAVLRQLDRSLSRRRRWRAYRRGQRRA